MAAVEPLRSANSTVTRLRSPSPARRCTGCLAAACSLAGAAGVTMAASPLPQPAQYRSLGTLAKPQDTHVRLSCAPHAVQNRPPDLLSVLHIGQSNQTPGRSVGILPSRLPRRR